MPKLTLTSGAPDRPACGATKGRDGDKLWSHLRSSSVSAVVVASAGAMPSLAYWGPPITDGDIETLNLLTARPIAKAALDIETPIGLLAEGGAGFSGSPGIEGHRANGQGFVPRFTNAAVTVTNAETLSLIHI